MTQGDALNILKMGHTAFLTGAAGSGKSYVLREYISYLRKHGIPHAVTASTGIAGTHINGTTIHAWSGIGIKDFITKHDLENFEEKQPLYQKWNNTEVLIIDEISMLSSVFLESLDKVAKHMRRNDKPFGGLQVVFCGDFFQLPPIVKNTKGIESMRDAFAYSAKAWKEAKPVVCYLTEQHRQKDDVLTTILNSVRKGDVDEFVWDHLEERGRESSSHQGEHTKLYTHNVDVDEINQKAFDSIEGKPYVYPMSTRGSQKLVDGLMKNCLAEETLRLKVGARVMCIKNDPDKKFQNGSLGIVVDFDKENTPTIELLNGKKIQIFSESWRIEDEGKVKAEITQLPLKLAWAITIHKSQGMTLDAAEIDLSKSFGSGMGYVALSRLRSIEGLYLKGIHAGALAIDEHIRIDDEAFHKRSSQAEDALKKYTKEGLVELHNAFILRAGGSLEQLNEEQAEEFVKKPSTILVTKPYIDSKKSIKEIAELRGLTQETIISHIEKLIEIGEKIDIKYLLPKSADKKKIIEAFAKMEDMKLTPVHEALKGKYSFQEIRLVRASLVQNP